MTQNASAVKTVMSEAIRLTKTSIQLFMSKQITKDEMETYQKRITDQLRNFYMDDKVIAAYAAVEADMEAHQANHD